jgi:multidrug efflux system outer membrane protein
VGGNANFNGGKEPNFQSRYNFLLLTADAAFQLDLFGKLRRATEASRAETLATEAARQTVILTLVSDIATDYYTLLQLDLQLEITHQTVSTQTDSVKLTNRRLDRGVATKLDVLQAQQVLDIANAQIPDLERLIAQEEDAISILIGNYPDAVQRGLALTEQTLPPEVPAGIPSALIERRPDIREAEQVLIATNAEIGVAKAQFFPQIALTGSGGGAFGRSSAFSGLMDTHLGIWSYGAQVSQPIFTGGALRGNLRLAESENQQALIAYRQTIQRAFGDVSDALVGYQKYHEVRERQQQTVADLAESVRLSNVRYTGGTTTYLEVLDGQRSLYSAELTLAEARGNEYRSLVQLYKALGGGWQEQNAPAPATQPASASASGH